MNRQNIRSGSPFEDSIGFSRAVRAANFIFVSGTAPILENGVTASPGDLYAQTIRCFEIMQRSVEDAGGSLKDVVRTRIYLKNAAHWKEAARAHGEFFADILPACTFVEVKGFINPDWEVETEMDCFISD